MWTRDIARLVEETRRHKTRMFPEQIILKICFVCFGPFVTNYFCRTHLTSELCIQHDSGGNIAIESSTAYFKWSISWRNDQWSIESPTLVDFIFLFVNRYRTFWRERMWLHDCWWKHQSIRLSRWTVYFSFCWRQFPHYSSLLPREEIRMTVSRWPDRK